MACGGCAARRVAMAQGAAALARGEFRPAVQAAGFVARTGAEDAAKLTRSAMQHLARLRLLSGRW